MESQQLKVEHVVRFMVALDRDDEGRDVKDFTSAQVITLVQMYINYEEVIAGVYYY